MRNGNPLATGRYSFDLPAVYQIRILGRLPSRWSDAVAGMTIDVTTAADETPVTVLRGEIADQAALCGLINELYDLQLTILAVVRLEDAHGS
jgi:hypothetical protein